jgi:hypothetical protein
MIDTTIVPFTATPNRQSPSTFSEDMDTRLAEENARISQMNLVSGEMNETATTMNEIEIAVAGDRDVTVLQAIYSKESADKSKQSEDAAEISLQSTIQVISEADITGTAGYTIDVVDDLLSRARNSQFVGLT